MVFRRTNGLFPLGHLKSEMDRLLEDFFVATPNALERAGVPVRSFPPINVWEEGEHLYVEAEMPGVKQENLDIQVVGNTLTLKGRRGEPAANGVAYHRQERGAGEFVRVVRVPVEVNADKVQAELKDGVLRITLPKAEVARPRKIQIGVG